MALETLFASLLAASLAVNPVTSDSPELAPQDNSIYYDQRFIYKNESTIVLNVPYVHQIDDLPEDKKDLIRNTACGPSALAMVLNYVGHDYSLWDVISTVPDSVYVKGKMYYALQEGPKYFGEEATEFEYSQAALFDKLSQGLPVVLNVQNYDGITGHALVVVGMRNFDGENADSLIVHDPFREGYREFKYLNPMVLEQPEGYDNYIGHRDPFYVAKKEVLASGHVD